MLALLEQLAGIGRSRSIHHQQLHPGIRVGDLAGPRGGVEQALLVFSEGEGIDGVAGEVGADAPKRSAGFVFLLRRRGVGASDAVGEPLAAQTYAVFQAAASQGKDRNAVMNLLILFIHK